MPSTWQKFQKFISHNHKVRDENGNKSKNLFQFWIDLNGLMDTQKILTYTKKKIVPLTLVKGAKDRTKIN